MRGRYASKNIEGSHWLLDLASEVENVVPLRSQLAHGFVYAFGGEDEDPVIGIGLGYPPFPVKVLRYDQELCLIGDVHSANNSVS